MEIHSANNMSLDIYSENQYALQGFVKYSGVWCDDDNNTQNGCVIIITHNAVFEGFVSLLSARRLFESYDRVFLIAPLELMQLTSGINRGAFKFINLKQSLNDIFAEISKPLPTLTSERGKKKVLPCSLPSLSYCEKRVLFYLLKGMSHARIAQITGQSIKTISSHKIAVMTKLRVGSTMALLLKLRTIIAMQEIGLWQSNGMWNFSKFKIERLSWGIWENAYQWHNPTREKKLIIHPTAKRARPLFTASDDVKYHEPGELSAAP